MVAALVIAVVIVIIVKCSSVGFKAMRFALGKPGIEMEDVIMKKKFDYSLAQKRVKLATASVTLVTALVKLAIVLEPLLSVAFNYSIKSHEHDVFAQMDFKV